MFVGHAFLAFGLATILARRFGSEAGPSIISGRIPLRYAVAVGLAAALFASLPDIDVVHAAFQVVSLPDGSTAFDHFWAATSDRHRTTTHSLLVAVVASLGFALWAVRRWMGWLALSGIVLFAAVADGPVGGTVMVLFATFGVVVATVADEVGLSPREIFGASLLGLVVHPFTDLLTGEPPAFFAPLDIVPIANRVEPFVDPTSNLLLAFGTELAVIWFGLVVAVAALGIDPRRHVHVGAVLGVVYAPMAFVLNGASVDNAVPFVATILPVGLTGVISRDRPWTITGGLTFVLTGLAAITLALFAFAVAYVALA
ncbi:metal-dependent hydrolase [Halorhabdus rudnickae]|uniref:metal-dependent hydrolase n=1 Tax=Halorhabdus rudnickae TaxID=1775544 RepID=UPI001082DB5F|nr:metal-dependent hydrolase [Halorhabdus rudnickae]